MTKRFPLVLAAVCVVWIATTGAYGATSPTKHKVSDTIELRVLTSGPTGAIFTGTVRDKANGAGAVVVSAKSGASSTTNDIAGTGFFKSGTIKVKGSITAMARSDGSGVDFAGTASAVGGTGAFKGAKGKLKLVGSATSQDPTYQTYKLTGTLTY